MVGALRMATSDGPPVEPGQPPRAVLRLVNPVLRMLLRSRLHQPLSKQFVLLTVTGRKTGRSYVIPVGRHESDGELLVCASGEWRHNLRGGARVRVTIDGHEHSGYAQYEEDPDTVAQAYRTLLERLGRGKARQLGLKLNVDRVPTLEELKSVVADQRGIARIHLTGN